MLIDAIGVPWDDTGGSGRETSSVVLGPALYSGHDLRRSRNVETSVITEDAIRLFFELHKIASGQSSHGADAETDYGSVAVSIAPGERSDPGERSLDATVPVDSETAARTQLELRLWWAFEAEPLEDGMDHAAEHLLAEHLAECASAPILEWISAWCLDTTNATFAASVLQCVARQPRPGTASWRTELVRRGLASPHVEIRDAAARAADSWGDSELLPILEGHQEPVPWLADFIRDVVTDRR